MKVLVTGGAGLIGSELIHQLLQQGKQIRALVHKTPIKHKAVELFECSILDVLGLEEAMKDVDVVYHCAGFVSYAHGMENTLHKINVEGTANVVNTALDVGVNKLVHVSSVATLNTNDNPVNENSKWINATGKTAYAQSKYYGEMEVWRAMAEGLPAVIVNPAVILGPGNWNEGSTAMFKSAYNSFPWYTNGVTGYVDVADVAKAMRLLTEKNIQEERFVLSGHNVSYKDIFTLMAEAFHKKAPNKKATPFLSGIVWRMERFKSMFTGEAPLLTRETAAMAFAENFYDGSKIQSFFPEFNYTPIKQTIQNVARLLQQKLNND
jgi:nucleoside-diphosphate-sugar epimerase